MSETIVAPSTPAGGAVAMIRLSGERSREIVEKLCGRKFDKFRTAYYVTADTGVVKDKCQAIIYESGKSYTGEESAEIFCHGSGVIMREIMAFCLRNGARTATRGEFTLRAYLNKKMDLTEAEGILDLINSTTVEQATEAYESADGKLREEIERLRRKLIAVAAKVDVAIDYPEEDVEQATKDEVRGELSEIADGIDRLVRSFGDGCRVKNGVRVVICGKPNVGKSELFNALIGKKRAIVSENAGTTRDYIESDYAFNGRKFVVVDTAGLREATDAVEERGIELSLEEAKAADLILGVGVADDEFDISSLGCGKKAEKLLSVTNKCDVAQGKNFNVSARENIGVEDLKRRIYEATDFDGTGLKINNLRQYKALVAAAEYIDSALRCNATLDCFASDLYGACDKLGSVTGAIGSDEIIAEIFSAFCVGK